MDISTRMITRAGVLVAVSVALGWLTISIPNVELITASIFVSGYWCGLIWGMIIGGVAEGLYSLTNPMGMPPPPLLIAQCLGMAIAGVLGGWIGQRRRHKSLWGFSLILGGFGLIITIIYDFLTTLSFPVSMGFHMSEIGKVLIMGIPFAVIHWISNTAIFAVLVPLVLKRLSSRVRNVQAVAIAVLLVFVTRTPWAQETPNAEMAIPADSVQSPIVDTLVTTVVLDTLPPLEQLMEPGFGIDSTRFDRRMNRAQILELGIEDVSDAVRYFPGTYPFDMATFGAFSGVWIRGQSPRNTEITLDGRVLNTRRNGMVNLNEITVEEIDEMFLYPASNSPSPPSTGGIIGFQSFLPMAEAPMSRIAVRAGYYGFTTVDFHIAQRISGNWVTNVVGEVGYFEDRGDNTQVESVHFRAHITRKPTPLWTGRLSYYHYRGKNESPFPISHHKAVRNDLVLSLVRRLKPSAEPRLEFQGWVTDIHKNDSEVLHESERRAGGELRAVTPVCSTGSVWAGVFGEGWEIANENNPTVGDNEFRVFSGASIPIIKTLSARSSLLYSIYKSDVKEPAGSVSVGYQPMSWINMTGTGEWAFRAPSYFERWGGGRLDIREDLMEPMLLYDHYETVGSSPGIEPERSRTFTAEATLFLPWNLRFSIGGYQKELTDPIVFHEVMDGGLMAYNGDATKWQGGHVACRWAVWDSLEISGVGNWNRVMEDQNSLVPEKSAWGALTYRHTYFHNHLRMLGRVEGLYWGEQNGVTFRRSYTLPEVTVVNIRLSGTIKDFTLYWGMNNLFSKHYELLGGFPMIHREEIFGVRWNFLD